MTFDEAKGSEFFRWFYLEEVEPDMQAKGDQVRVFCQRLKGSKRLSRMGFYWHTFWARVGQ
jgi:hypothetical protein